MQTVRRNQLVADTIHFALDSPADGLSVQVAVVEEIFYLQEETEHEA